MVALQDFSSYKGVNNWQLNSQRVEFVAFSFRVTDPRRRVTPLLRNDGGCGPEVCKLFITKPNV